MAILRITVFEIRKDSKILKETQVGYSAIDLGKQPSDAAQERAKERALKSIQKQFPNASTINCLITEK